MEPTPALPPSEPLNVAKASKERSDAPGGAGASPINFLTSVTNGREVGNIPADWQCGVCWDQVGCEPGCLWLDPCDPLTIAEEGEEPVFTNPDEKPTSGPGKANACAFDIVHGVEACCHRSQTASLEQLARTQLEAVTPARMANYYSMLLQANGEKLPGTKCPPIETAIGMLFEARAAAGAGGGVLSIADRGVGAAQASGIITRSGARYTSIYGSQVIVGPGIQNVGPGGEPAPTGSVWIYVSSAVDYALAPIERVDLTNSWDQAKQNDIWKAIVERKAMVRMDECGVFAICAALPCSCCDEEGEG